MVKLIISQSGGGNSLHFEPRRCGGGDGICVTPNAAGLLGARRAGLNISETGIFRTSQPLRVFTEESLGEEKKEEKIASEWQLRSEKMPS